MFAEETITFSCCVCACAHVHVYVRAWCVWVCVYVCTSNCCCFLKSSNTPLLHISFLCSCFLLFFFGSRKFSFKRFKSISKSLLMEWIFTKYGCTLLMVINSRPWKTHGINAWSQGPCNMALKETCRTIIRQIGLPLKYKEHVIKFRGDNEFLIMLWCAIEHKEKGFNREWKLTWMQGYPFCRVECRRAFQ